jgi:hypothetical protein
MACINGFGFYRMPIILEGVADPWNPRELLFSELLLLCSKAVVGY